MIGLGNTTQNASISFSQRGDTTVQGSYSLAGGVQLAGDITTNGAANIGLNYNPTGEGTRRDWNFSLMYDMAGTGLSASAGYAHPGSTMGLTTTVNRDGMSTSAELTGVGIATNGPDGFQMDEINFAEQNINAAQDRTQDDQNPNGIGSEDSPPNENDFFDDMTNAGTALAGILAGGAAVVTGLFGGTPTPAAGGAATPVPSASETVVLERDRRREEEEGGVADNQDTDRSNDQTDSDLDNSFVTDLGTVSELNQTPAVGVSTSPEASGTGQSSNESKDLPKTVPAKITEYTFTKKQSEQLGRLVSEVVLGEVKNQETIKALDGLNLKLNLENEKLYQAEGHFEYSYKEISVRIERLQQLGLSDSDIAKKVKDDQKLLAEETKKIVKMREEFGIFQKTIERDMQIVKIGELGINGQKVDISNPNVKNALNKLLDPLQPERMRGAAVDFLVVNKKIDLGSELNNVKTTKELDLPTSNNNLPPGAGYTRVDTIGDFNIKMPGVPGEPVTSPIGNRKDPISQEPNRTHTGFDSNAKLGTPQAVPVDGKVISISGSPLSNPFDSSNAYGLRVEVQIGNSDYGYSISHNSAILVTEGQKVTAGQAISLSGNTGKTEGTTGNHVHAEILKKDEHGRWRAIVPTKEDLIQLEKLGVASAK